MDPATVEEEKTSLLDQKSEDNKHHGTIDMAQNGGPIMGNSPSFDINKYVKDDIKYIDDDTADKESKNEHEKIAELNENGAAIDKTDENKNVPNSNTKSKDTVDAVVSLDDAGFKTNKRQPSDGESGTGSGIDVTDWDKLSQYSLFMAKRDFRYYFQHPYSRIFVAYLVTFCNFLIYAEDPVAHSVKECYIPVVGNVASFVISKYPPNAWSVLKVFLWLAAIICGIFFGKFVVHKILFRKLFRLRMFQEDQGSWMVMFFTTIMFLYIFSWIYNAFLLIGGESTTQYAISDLLGLKNSWFMKAAACGTWCGDFFTAWMVTDIMLQEKLYPQFARPVRRWWNRRYNRIIMFWVFVVSLTVIVVVIISTDIIQWDRINRDFVPSNEISRSILASFILLMDLLIVMQDWDFPHFINSFDIKLPGLNTASINFKIPKIFNPEKWEVHITGKWFNYGIIFIVMILDLNMWKNQIFYVPYDYGQYTDADYRIHTVLDTDQLIQFNQTQITYAWRSNNTNPQTNMTYLDEDRVMFSRFYDFSYLITGVAFIPSFIGFIIFGVLIWRFGREKPTKKDPYAGRMKKRPKRKGSRFNIFGSWRKHTENPESDSERNVQLKRMRSNDEDRVKGTNNVTFDGFDYVDSGIATDTDKTNHPATYEMDSELKSSDKSGSSQDNNKADKNLENDVKNPELESEDDSQPGDVNSSESKPSSEMPKTSKTQSEAMTPIESTEKDIHEGTSSPDYLNGDVGGKVGPNLEDDNIELDKVKTTKHESNNQINDTENKIDEPNDILINDLKDSNDKPTETIKDSGMKDMDNRNVTKQDETKDTNDSNINDTNKKNVSENPINDRESTDEKNI
ncbi:unnamed protein product [Owenia fusiformis]|nr:unnamed protein product [Owenia fusiformis]